MRVVIALLLLLVAAPMARAESTTPDQPLQPEAVQPAVVPSALAPSMSLKEVKVPEVRAVQATVASTQEMPRRGSFWWLVGVIVVAGIILAVVLR